MIYDHDHDHDDDDDDDDDDDGDDGAKMCGAHSLSAEEKYSLHPLIAGLSNGSYLDLHEKSCDPVEQGTATWTHWQQQTATASHKPLASVAWFVPEISYFHMPPQSDMKPIEIYLGTQRCILLTQKRGNVVSSANWLCQGAIQTPRTMRFSVSWPCLCEEPRHLQWTRS